MVKDFIIFNAGFAMFSTCFTMWIISSWGLFINPLLLFLFFMLSGYLVNKRDLEEDLRVGEKRPYI